MDANIIGNAGVGLAQGLERGLQNAYQINRQGMTDRLAIQKMAEESKAREMTANMQNVQMEQIQIQLAELKKAKLKETAYNATNAYFTDGNYRHLNNALQETPELKSLFGGITRVDPIDTNNEADMRMFQEAGGQDYSTPEARKRYVKVTDASGNTRIADMFAEAKKNGTWKTWTDEQFSNLEKEAKIAELNAKAAYYEGKGIGGTGEKTAMQKNADYLEKIDPTLKEDYLKKETGWAPTTTTKELTEVDKARATVLKTNQDFFKTTYVPGTDEYRQMEPNIQKIEKNLGIKLNSTDKKEMADIKRIITLGDTAKKLTPEDTGMIDNLVGNVKKYVSDDAPAEAKNAYSQMMTTIRNGLYGATLPAAEMASFTQAFGSLYQQDKAVKSALKTSLDAVKSKMEVFADTGDEAVTHFRYGADAAKLSKIIDNLDTMIATVDGKQGSKGSIKPNIPLPSKTTDVGNGDYKTPPPAPSKYQEGQRARNPKTGATLVYTNGKWVAE